MEDALLVLNAGSSSLKFALFAPGSPPRRRARGRVEGLGGEKARFHVDGEEPKPMPPPAGHAQALARVLEWVQERGTRLLAAGHRIVHGGTDYAAPVRVDEAVRSALQRLVPLAPLHQPHNLAAVEALARQCPGLPQVACFDTAFHRSQPEPAQCFALPRQLTAAGVRRYGFHGLSYEYIARALPAVTGGLPHKTLVAHLGNGASLCALKDGRSVATTMGFTPLDGVPMGTRPGSLDPGAVLYLFQGLGMSVAQVEDLLYHRSGLLGVSGISHDMRTLLASTDPRARQAVELFVYDVARAVGSLAAALGGVDALVFTAGIGEHAPVIREAICRQAAWLGVELDPAANAEGRTRISTGDSRVAVWVIPTDEESMIARHTQALLETEPN